MGSTPWPAKNAVGQRESARWSRRAARAAARPWPPRSTRVPQTVAVAGRKTRVIGMQMRQQDACQGSLHQHCTGEVIPGFTGGVGGHAGIHQRVPTAVLQQPKIDVVQGNGQRHPQPPHAFLYRNHLGRAVGSEGPHSGLGRARRRAGRRARPAKSSRFQGGRRCVD